MNKRANRKDFTFEDLMQADFLLFLLYQIDDKESSNTFWASWYPTTLTFAEYRDKPFEVFSRSQSRKFFDKFKVCLRNASKKELLDLFEKIKENKESSFGRRWANLSSFTGIDQIATRP